MTLHKTTNLARACTRGLALVGVALGLALGVVPAADAATAPYQALADPLTLPNCDTPDSADEWQMTPQVRRVLAGRPFPLRVSYDDVTYSDAEHDWYPAEVRVADLTPSELAEIPMEDRYGLVPTLIEERIGEPPADRVVTWTAGYGAWPVYLWVTRVAYPGWHLGEVPVPASDADLAGRQTCVQVVELELTATATSPRLHGLFDVDVSLPWGGSDTAVWRFTARCPAPRPCAAQLRSSTGLRVTFRHRGNWTYTAAKAFPAERRNCLRGNQVVGFYTLRRTWRLTVTSPRFQGEPVSPIAGDFHATSVEQWIPGVRARQFGCRAFKQPGPIVDGTIRY